MEIAKLREKHGLLPPKNDNIQIYEKGHLGEPAYHLGAAVAYDPMGFLGHMTTDDLIGYDHSVNRQEKVTTENRQEYEVHKRTFDGEVERILKKFGPDSRLRASGE